jgi:hypothetical protein
MAKLPLERLLARIRITPPPSSSLRSNCWEWTGGTCNHGYGQIGIRSAAGKYKRVLVHRLAYEELVGPVPDGKELDHLCRNRLCINPDHVEPVTHTVNLRRGVKKTNITHCPKGHPYDDENTYIDERGRRTCKKCKRLANQEYKKRRKQNGRN